jgi:cyanate permease
MQRVWAVVLSVWAMLAIVAVLAWSHHPVPTAAPATQAHAAQPGVSTAPHATTATSAVVKP